MSRTCTETIPQTWSDEQDGTFFTLVARLFSPAFAYGAGVLLGGNDPDTDPAGNEPLAPEAPVEREVVCVERRDPTRPAPR